jgi:hypothetical protein
MSSILEEAVIHANTLREAAIKNAEQIVIEKYSADIKDAVEKLLEGTEEVLDSIPFAHEELLTKEEVETKPVELPLKDVTGKEELQEELDIDLEQVKQLLEETEEDSIVIEEDQAGGEYEESVYESDCYEEEQLDEEFELEEGDENPYHFASNIGEDLDEEYTLDESIHFNHKVVPTGWLGANQSTLGEAELFDIVARIAEESMKEEREAHKKELEKAQKEQETLKQELAESKKKLNHLSKQNEKLEQTVQSLKETLVETNTSNGKLFYTNRVLKDPSLNERQKEKLVENLSKAQSLEQAKVIYETLNSVGSTNGSVQKPKSLSEALNRNSSLVVSPRRTEERKEADPVSDRWKRLAGL